MQHHRLVQPPEMPQEQGRTKTEGVLRHSGALS